MHITYIMSVAFLLPILLTKLPNNYCNNYCKNALDHTVSFIVTSEKTTSRMHERHNLILISMFNGKLICKVENEDLNSLVNVFIPSIIINSQKICSQLKTPSYNHIGRT